MRGIPVKALGLGLVVAAIAACSATGSDEYSAGSGGNKADAAAGGTGATGGTGGTAGTGGTGGTGASGEAGSGGSGATGGESGSAGNAGTGGVAGSAGTGGSAGAAGSGGSAGTAGTGGSAGHAGTGGSAGAAGSGGGTGVLGDPCTEDSECVSGECIEGPDGDTVCSQKCTDTCPPDWRCAVLQGATDPGGYCVPRFSRLCRPCDDDDACRLANVPSETGRCVPRAAEGSFCGATCSTTDPCPTGYFCDTIDFGGALVKQCVPENGALCECKTSWAGKGYSTTCFEQNGHGLCTGTRDCDTGELSDCDAPTPAAEVCDGSDNNCNSLEDEGNLCDDGLSCTTDTCGGANGCVNALQATACGIGYACYASGQANPSNPCQVCNPQVNPTDWTTIPYSCAIGNACVGAGTTNPTAPCQVCNPLESTTDWSIVSNKCLIGGSCYDANQSNPSSACQKCSPSDSQTNWTAQANSCAIGTECFFNGQTNPVVSCQVCNTAASSSQWSIVPGNCYISGSCYANGGTMAGNPCWACLASTSQTAWSANTGASCNDGTACTSSDTCKSDGTCSGTMVQDAYESNNTVATAYNIGNMTDDSDAGKTIAAKLSGSSDIDWYGTYVADTTGHIIDPAIAVQSGGATVRVCLYFNCASGDEVLTCEGGSTADNSLSGYGGCCKTGGNPSFSVNFSECDGGSWFDDSFTARMRIDSLQTLMCVDYSYDVEF